MTRPAIILALALVAGCGEGQSALDRMMQNRCVHNNLNLDRTIQDGQECSSFSYGDCGGDPTPMASDCINYCAFDVCQPGPCAVDSDCTMSLGIDYECINYVVSDDDYGKWCGVSSCPKGTPDCPCLPDSTCYEPDEWWDVTCNAQNICEGGDGCPYGCRQGSVCCGGAFCSGNCIGTPCC